MDSSRPVSDTLPWYEREWFIKTICYWFIAIVAIKFFQGVFFKQNDFDVHLAWGELAVRGTLHGDRAAFDSLLFQYPPGRLIFDEALAMLPRLWARAITLFAAIVSLFVIRAIWRELAARVSPATPSVEFASSSLALVLLAPWVLRDFDECGLQILLLAFLSMAGWCLYHGSRVQFGAWLGLAITFKITPVLFLPLLILKRRFVEAVATVCFVVAFNVVAPVVLWGPELTSDALKRHWSLLQRSVTLEDAAANVVEPPKHNNQSLKFAIARYLQTFPKGHPLFIDRNYDGTGCLDRAIPLDQPGECEQHPLFIQFLDLPKSTAKKIVAVIILIMGLAVAWRMRRAWRLAAPSSRDSSTSALAPEWAVGCIFAVLLSPLAWHQHMVLALPCAYLVIRDTISLGKWHLSRVIALSSIAFFIWILSRDPLSKLHSLIAMSYHFDVLVLLMLIAMALGIDGAVSGGKRENSEVRT